MKKYSVLPWFALLSLMGCTIATLSPEGERVHVVTSITATDLVYYDRVGLLESLYMKDEENCMHDLKNKAAAVGATVILIASKTTGEPCGIFGSDKTCVSMKANAYRRKPDSKQ